MKTALMLIMFVMSLCGIPTIWFMVELFIESGTREFKPIINAVITYIDAISPSHDDRNINKLFWDYKTNTMYGCPVTEMEDKT